MNDPDEWLMHQVAAGQSRCLEPLVRRYAGPLLTFIQRLVGQRHNPEEIFQDVFLAVWAKRQTYRYPATFRPWLYTIAANRCRLALRRHDPFFLSIFEDSIEDDGDRSVPADSRVVAPADTAIATETAAVVEAAVARLPDRQRAVVVLRVYSGLSYADIATALATREATVRSAMHEALANLRRYLEPRLRDRH